MVDNVSASVMQLIIGTWFRFVRVETIERYFKLSQTFAPLDIVGASMRCPDAGTKQAITILVTWHGQIYKVQQIIEQKFSIFATNCQGRELSQRTRTRVLFGDKGGGGRGQQQI